MKKTHHTYFKRVVAFFCIMMIMFFTNQSEIMASTIQNNSPIIMVEKYTVDSEKIVPGQDFTLKLYLKNHNDDRSAQDVMLNLENPDGVAPVYGTTSQVYVGTIGAGKTKEVEIQYKSWASIQAECLDFTLTIVSDQPTNQVVLRIPVGADSPLNVTSSSVSTEVKLGEAGSAVISFEALADNNVSDITIILREGTTNIANSSIGNVTAGSTKTKKIPFYIDKVGKHEIEMLLQYNNQLGQIQEVSLGKWTVNVTQEGVTSEDFADSNQGATSTEIVSNERIAILGGCGVAILLICIIIAIFLHKKR